MQTIFHPSESRGHANHGWLDSYHSFSFAGYYNHERMGFGLLRVLNDDCVEGGKGFGSHPHENMEIISIPLKGELVHRDNMGHVLTIKAGDIQVMSAGSGIVHSEYNNDADRQVKFLQIWVHPKMQNVSPRYDQFTVEPEELKNKLYPIVVPQNEAGGVWIHQDAWFSLGNFDEKSSTTYHIKKEGNGLYIFVLEGKVQIKEQELKQRDAMGITETDSVDLTFNAPSKLLLIDVPMQ